MIGNELIALLNQNTNVYTSMIGPVVGAIFTLIFLRKNTAVQEFEKIKAGMFRKVAEDLLNSGRMTYTEFYKTNNFLQIAEMADEEYDKMPHTEKFDTYDFDWFIRFFEAAGNISNEKMQYIWAQILAGEINKPNTYSLRTIEVLKNMSQKDAELFEKICSHCMNRKNYLFLPNNDKYLESFQIKFSEILQLDEIGLIKSDSMLILDIPVDENKNILFASNTLLCTVSSKNNINTTFSISQYPLTSVGHELSVLVKSRVTDEDFLKYAKELSNDKTIRICVYKITSYDDEKIHFCEDDLLEQSN